MRAFLAVEPDAEVHARLVAVKQELAGCGAAVRWVRDDALHITVKFLGSVTRETLAAIHADLGSITSSGQPMAGFAGLGVFPDARRPRVLWARVRCEALTTLCTIIEHSTTPLGVAPESRPLVPHVTLGRLTSPRTWPRLEPTVLAHARTNFGTCTFPALVAFRSDLRPGGALYTKLWSIPFGA
jgi:2'-5' RNA ligase